MGEYNTLGNRMKGLRLRMNLSQSDLAKQLNCTQAALSQYECGNREPGLRDLINIAEKLNTTTDFLLGITDIASTDYDVKMIGDYLGLTESSISTLRKYYWKYKKQTQEDYLQEDVRFYSGTSPGCEGYEDDLNYVRRQNQLDLDDYKKFINDFICSSAFHTLFSCLTNNLFIERTTYDLMRIAAKKYSEIETPLHSKNIAEIAYGLAEDSEDNMQRYSLNLFDAQNALISFCQNFTQLEKIKQLNFSEIFYRKLHFFIFNSTRPMFETGNFSTEVLENELSQAAHELLPKVITLLDEK